MLTGMLAGQTALYGVLAGAQPPAPNSAKSAACLRTEHRSDYELALADLARAVPDGASRPRARARSTAPARRWVPSLA